MVLPAPGFDVGDALPGTVAPRRASGRPRAAAASPRTRLFMAFPCLSAARGHRGTGGARARSRRMVSYAGFGAKFSSNGVAYPSPGNVPGTQLYLSVKPQSV